MKIIEIRDAYYNSHFCTWDVNKNQVWQNIDNYTWPRDIEKIRAEIDVLPDGARVQLEDGRFRFVFKDDEDDE